MKERLNRLADSEKFNDWFIPVMIGVAYFVLATTVKVPVTIGVINQWFVVVTYLVLGVVWAMTVRSYGRNIRSRTERAARFTGMYPPRGVWAEYGEERIDNLPFQYCGIDNLGHEVWEVMLPKTEKPTALGAEMIPGLCALRMHTGPRSSEDLY